MMAARPSTNEGESTTTTRGITLGATGITMDASIAKEMNLPSGTQGVLIEQVQSGSLADTAGLRGGTKSVMINAQQIKVGGDIITAVNEQPVASLQELRAALAQLTSNQALSFAILRNGTEIQITIQPGQ